MLLRLLFLSCSICFNCARAIAVTVEGPEDALKDGGRRFTLTLEVDKGASHETIKELFVAEFRKRYNPPHYDAGSFDFHEESKTHFRLTRRRGGNSKLGDTIKSLSNVGTFFIGLTTPEDEEDVAFRYPFVQNYLLFNFDMHVKNADLEFFGKTIVFLFVFLTFGGVSLMFQKGKSNHLSHVQNLDKHIMRSRTRSPGRNRTSNPITTSPSSSSRGTQSSPLVSPGSGSSAKNSSSRLKVSGFKKAVYNGVYVWKENEKSYVKRGGVMKLYSKGSGGWELKENDDSIATSRDKKSWVNADGVAEAKAKVDLAPARAS